MNATIKSLLRMALHGAGGIHLVRYARRQRLRILMYHGFSSTSQDSLARQCEHLRRYYHVLSLTEASNALRSGGPLPGNAVVITVDDGYRNFFDFAYPVFRKSAIPAMVYLTTDFVDGKDWLWVDRVSYAFHKTSLSASELDLGGSRLRFELASRASRAMAALKVMHLAKGVPDEERLRMLEALAGTLRVEMPQSPPEEYAPLSWEQVRAAAQNGMEFGAHTVSHPLLSRVSDAAKLRHEIAGSKQRIESELGRPVLHFCYPNGTMADISPEAIAAVQDSGYGTAVTAVPGLNDAHSDPFLLKRVGVEPDFADLQFRERMAGLRLGGQAAGYGMGT